MQALQALQLTFGGPLIRFDLGALARHIIDYLVLVTGKRNRNNFGECHRDNLICTTHRLTDGIIVHNSILFLPFLWRSTPSPQGCKAPKLRY
jgi:hypothetical protein